MVSFLDAATAALRGSYCAATDRLGVYSELYLGGSNPLGSAALQAANFLHNLACDRPPPSATAPPFTGGQCAGSYNVTIAWTATAIPGSGLPNESGSDTIAVNGPVQGASVVHTSGRFYAEIRAASIPINGGASSYRYRSVSDGFYSGATATITSVVRTDGGTDNCGNPPNVRPPYTPGDNVVNTNITYNNSNNTSVTVPVVIAFGYAKVDVNGVLQIPFTLNAPITPTLNISGNINLGDNSIHYDSGNPALPPRSCGFNSDDVAPDPSDTIPPSGGNPDVSEPNPADPKPQTRKLMVGCLVTATTIPPQVTVIPQDANPDIYAPDIGTVSFKISIGGKVGWTEDIRVKNSRQIIPCPWDGGAIDVKGTPRTNGSFTVTPLYEKRTLGQTYPQ